MTTQEARQMFAQAIAATTDKDEIAKLELAREYFTNTDFRKAMEQHTWELSQSAK